MPLSSVLNTKDSTIQEKSDTEEFKGNKKNDAKDGGDHVTGFERKIEDIEGCEIERRIEQPTNAPLMSFEVGHETDEPPKKKKRKRTKDGETGEIRDDSTVEDKIEEINQAAEAINNLSNDMGAGCVRQDSEEKPKKKKKKRAIESQYGGVENESKFDVQEEEKFKVEARIDDTSKNELVKDQPIDNLSNDKEIVQSSHENDVKTKKKENIQAKERKTTEVGDDSKIDAQEENIQVKETVNSDFNQEVPVKDNFIDNISIDKGVGCVGHESEEKPKKKKKKRVKESRNVGVENDNKIDVHEEENFKVQARIDDITKIDPVKDQANENLSFDKVVVQFSKENDVKTKKTKKRAKDRQIIKVGEDSMIGACKEEEFQVEEAGGNDINQEVAVKDKAIENISNDKRAVTSEAGNEIQEKPTKKKKKRVKEEPTGRINDSIYDAQKRAKSQLVKANTQVELLKDEGVGNQLNEKFFVQQNDSSLLALKIGHDNKEKPKKKKKKRAKDGQTGGVGEDSLRVVHKEVQSETFKSKTDDITMEERITEEFDIQSNDMFVTVDANYVPKKELTEKREE